MTLINIRVRVYGSRGTADLYPRVRMQYAISLEKGLHQRATKDIRVTRLLAVFSPRHQRSLPASSRVVISTRKRETARFNRVQILPPGCPRL